MFDCSVECGESEFGTFKMCVRFSKNKYILGIEKINNGRCPRPTIPPWSPSGPELLGIFS